MRKEPARRGRPRKGAEPTRSARAGNDATRLLVALRRRMIEENLTPQGAAARLGMAYTRLLALLGGHTPASGFDRTTVQKLSQFLNASPVQIMVWSGQLKDRDFYAVETAESLADRAYRDFVMDPVYGQLAPTAPQWAHLAVDLKVKIVALYSRLRDRTFAAAVEFEHIEDRIGQVLGLDREGTGRDEPKRKARKR